MNNHTNNLYDECFDNFGFQRDVRLKHHALYLPLHEKDVIDVETYKKHWYALMETDLQHIRNNLENKAKNKQAKPNFHSSVFTFFRRLKFR